MWASAKGHTEIVETLLRSGAEVNAQEENGSTALRFAARNGRLDVVLELLERGTDVNAQTKNGMTALMSASYQGHTKIVEALLRSGADKTIRDAWGSTALVYAVSSNDSSEVAELLLEENVNSDADGVGDKDDWTLLMFAANNNASPEVCEFLLSKGLDVNTRDRLGLTAYDIAKINNAPSQTATLLCPKDAVEEKVYDKNVISSLLAPEHHIEVLNFEYNDIMLKIFGAKISSPKTNCNMDVKMPAYGGE